MPLYFDFLAGQFFAFHFQAENQTVRDTYTCVQLDYQRDNNIIIIIVVVVVVCVYNIIIITHTMPTRHFIPCAELFAVLTRRDTDLAISYVYRCTPLKPPTETLRGGEEKINF